MTTTQITPGVVADHVDAVNRFDLDAIVATFADDAIVNDARREFRGRDSIRAWVAKEMVGDRVTIAVTEVLDEAGMTIVRGEYDGDYPKDGLPDPLILTNYFLLEGDLIRALFVIRNQ